ncbi:MAG TPA: tetratricopeptide repeat protein [Sphingomicrobium sp.]|nr:tetratricopeptide repeat protein [Sphingomicrobium sp.]
MKPTISALGIVLAFASVPAFGQLTRSNDRDKGPEPAQTEAKEGELRPSSGAMKALGELQKAVQAKDAASIPAKVAAAQAVAKTKEDRYFVALFQRQAAIDANNLPALAAAVDALAASGVLDTKKVSDLYRDLGSHQFNAKQFAPAAASFQRAASMTPNDPELLEVLAQAQAAAGQKGVAAAGFLKAIQARVAAGQKPPELLYQMAVQTAYDSQSPEAIEIGRQWIAAYPSPESWRNAMLIYRNSARPDAATAFDILRLARLTNALKGTNDYHIYAWEAAGQANYGEAKSLMDEAVAAGKVNASDPIIAEILAELKNKKVPTAADLAAAEKGAAVPTAFIRVGDRYYGAGQYQKAAELYRQALAKGADASLANLRLGEALARAGDKAGAEAAFKAVTGQRAEIAKFWLIYLRQS